MHPLFAFLVKLLCVNFFTKKQEGCVYQKKKCENFPCLNVSRSVSSWGICCHRTTTDAAPLPLPHRRSQFLVCRKCHPPFSLKATHYTVAIKHPINIKQTIKLVGKKGCSLGHVLATRYYLLNFDTTNLARTEVADLSQKAQKNWYKCIGGKSLKTPCMC